MTDIPKKDTQGILEGLIAELRQILEEEHREWAIKASATVDEEPPPTRDRGTRSWLPTGVGRTTEEVFLDACRRREDFARKHFMWEELPKRVAAMKLERAEGEWEEQRNKIIDDFEKESKARSDDFINRFRASEDSSKKEPTEDCKQGYLKALREHVPKIAEACDSAPYAVRIVNLVPLGPPFPTDELLHFYDPKEERRYAVPADPKYHGEIDSSLAELESALQTGIKVRDEIPEKEDGATALLGDLLPPAREYAEAFCISDKEKLEFFREYMLTPSERAQDDADPSTSRALSNAVRHAAILIALGRLVLRGSREDWFKALVEAYRDFAHSAYRLPRHTVERAMEMGILEPDAKFRREAAAKSQGESGGTATSEMGHGHGDSDGSAQGASATCRGSAAQDGAAPDAQTNAAARYCRQADVMRLLQSLGMRGKDNTLLKRVERAVKRGGLIETPDGIEEHHARAWALEQVQKVGLIANSDYAGDLEID